MRCGFYFGWLNSSNATVKVPKLGVHRNSSLVKTLGLLRYTFGESTFSPRLSVLLGGF